MSKYTPGPWDLVPNGRDSKRLTDCRYGEQRKSIGIVYAGNDEEEANARLIAAAPEMLEALKRAEWALLDLCQRAGVADYPAVEAIRAAVAKAEGSETC
jgi:hypothetical protein